MGKVCALRLSQAGYSVFAGVRKPRDAQMLKQERSTRLIPVMLDVTDEHTIAEVFQLTRETIGAAGLVGLVNNARVGVTAPIELVPLEEVRRQFEMNVIGQMAVRVGMETWSLKDLSPQKCAMLCMVNDVCNQTLGLPFQWKEEVQASLMALDEGFGTFVMCETNQVWSRGIVSVKERAPLSLAVDVMHQTVGELFRFHLWQARQQGVSSDHVRAMIHFLGECSMVKAWETFVALQRLLHEGEQY